jgi:hypothetical protein
VALATAAYSSAAQPMRLSCGAKVDNCCCTASDEEDAPSHHGTPRPAAGHPPCGEAGSDTRREPGRDAAAAAAAAAGAAPGAQARSAGGGMKHSHGSSRGDISAHSSPVEVVRRRGRTPVSAKDQTRCVGAPKRIIVLSRSATLQRTQAAKHGARTEHGDAAVVGGEAAAGEACKGVVLPWRWLDGRRQVLPRHKVARYRVAPH